MENADPSPPVCSDQQQWWIEIGDVHLKANSACINLGWEFLPLRKMKKARIDRKGTILTFASLKHEHFYIVNVLTRIQCQFSCTLVDNWGSGGTVGWQFNPRLNPWPRHFTHIALYECEWMFADGGSEGQSGAYWLLPFHQSAPVTLSA